MIRTTIRAEVEGSVYEYVVELPGVAPWADSPAETAIGQLHDSMDRLVRVLCPDEVTEPPRVELVDQYGNRVCYLCGFYHDEPGACADPSTPLTNLNPGPPEPPEYDGPTMPDDVRYPVWEGPAYDDFASPDTDHEDTDDDDEALMPPCTCTLDECGCQPGWVDRPES
jgi:hypothetical protein